MEAKYIVLSQAEIHVVWLKSMLCDLQFLETFITHICNNSSTIDLLKNYQISELTRNIHIHHLHFWELVYNKLFLLMYNWTM
jgi:hypothetical protein